MSSSNTSKTQSEHIHRANLLRRYQKARTGQAAWKQNHPQAPIDANPFTEEVEKAGNALEAWDSVIVQMLPQPFPMTCKFTWKHSDGETGSEECPVICLGLRRDGVVIPLVWDEYTGSAQAADSDVFASDRLKQTVTFTLDRKAF